MRARAPSERGSNLEGKLIPRKIRDGLGISRERMARLLDVSTRTVERCGNCRVRTELVSLAGLQMQAWTDHRRSFILGLTERAVMNVDDPHRSTRTAWLPIERVKTHHGWEGRSK